MSKKFDVYKWRRNHINEAVDMGPLNNSIYREVVEWLKFWNIDVKSEILEKLPTAIQRGILQSSREPINEEIQGRWVEKKGKIKNKEYDGYFKTVFIKDEDKILDKIKEKGYTYVDSEDWPDDNRETEYWYYYKK
jgi:hypothetical protein